MVSKQVRSIYNTDVVQEPQKMTTDNATNEIKVSLYPL